MSKVSGAEAQGRAELANAEAHGNSDRVRAARKLLEASGVKEAAEQRRAEAKGSDRAKSRPPVNRSTPKKQSTASQRKEPKSSDGDA